MKVRRLVAFALLLILATIVQAEEASDYAIEGWEIVGVWFAEDVERLAGDVRQVIEERKLEDGTTEARLRLLFLNDPTLTAHQMSAQAITTALRKINGTTYAEVGADGYGTVYIVRPDGRLQMKSDGKIVSDGERPVGGEESKSG
jgi:hypothetical protein